MTNPIKLIQTQDFCCAVCFDTLVDFELDEQLTLKYKPVSMMQNETKKVVIVALVCHECYKKLQAINFDGMIAHSMCNVLSMLDEVNNTNELTSD